IKAPENYKVSGDASKTQAVTSGNTTTYIFYVEEATVPPVVKGSLEVYVYKKDTTTPVSGVTVSVGEESLGTTDSTGKKEKSDLEAGDYTVSIKAPENYKVSGDASQTKEVKAGDTTTYIFYVEEISVTPTKGSIEVYVYKKGTTEGVIGAKVSVGGETLETIETGNIVKNNLAAGDYTVSITAPENYKVSGKDSKTDKVTKGNTTTYIFYVEETGSLIIKVEDEVTGNPVKGAKVSVKQPDGNTKYFTTDENGEVSEYSKTASGNHNTPVGNYKITVTEAPSGYNVTTGNTNTVSVTQGNEITHIAKVDLVKGGALIIKVVDEETGKPVKGVSLEVTEPDGSKKTYVTDADGEVKDYIKIVKDKKGNDVYLSPVGEYNIKIVSVPDGATVTVGKESTVNVSLGQKSEHLVKINTSSTNNTNPGNTNPGNTNPGNTNSGNTNPGNTNPGNANPSNTTVSNTNTSNNTSTASNNTNTGSNLNGSSNSSDNKDTSNITVTSIDTQIKGTGGNNSTAKSLKTGESKLPYILFASIMLMIIVGAIIYIKVHKEDDLEDIRL
ncbi:MAG: hypothetical protein IKX08_01225, partial [Lachnospiraceae bacterium]|nr:hypothetical protein [Lachnospiraceae bacterium]